MGENLPNLVTLKPSLKLRLRLNKKGRGILDYDQGCQMAYFQTKNPNLGKFWMI
jgi:hypothetical protein